MREDERYDVKFCPGLLFADPGLLYDRNPIGGPARREDFQDVHDQALSAAETGRGGMKKWKM
jgi:hypothetical protein